MIIFIKLSRNVREKQQFASLSESQLTIRISRQSRQLLTKMKEKDEAKFTNI